MATTKSLGVDTGPSAAARDEVVFRPIRSGNVFEETVQRLTQAIKLGVVPPGDRLPPERELVSRLGVSRATLREAIRVLQQAGYLAARRGRTGGTFVLARPGDASKTRARRMAREMGPDLLDALAFRSVVEPGAAELAAQHAEGRNLAPLRAQIAEMAQLPRSAYRSADSRFHLAIAGLSGSPSLVAAVADVQVRLSDLLAAIPLLDEALRHSDVQHRAILEAIEADNGDEARRLMREHIAATATLLNGFLG